MDEGKFNIISLNVPSLVGLKYEEDPINDINFNWREITLQGLRTICSDTIFNHQLTPKA